MPQPVLNRLRNYFQNVADGLNKHKEISAVLGNNSDIGSSREDLLVTFLKNHLPNRISVTKGGFIFDMLGNESKQMDIIITNDVTMQFRQLGKSFSCIEGCYAAISVKTKLDSSSIVDALENIASIPPMANILPEDYYGIHYAEVPEDFQSLPIKVIFAFDSISSEKLGEHIVKFYNNNEVPWYRKPDMIVVNNKFFVGYTGNTTLKISDEVLPPDTFYPVIGGKYHGSYCLLMMLSNLQVGIKVASKLFSNFSKYVDAINFKE